MYVCVCMYIKYILFIIFFPRIQMSIRVRAESNAAAEDHGSGRWYGNNDPAA